MSDHFRKLARMYLSAPVTKLYGIKDIVINSGEAQIEWMVDQKFFHAADGLHGSVYFRLLDDAAFFASNSLESHFFVLTASFEIKMFMPVSSGILMASGIAKALDTRSYWGESKLFDQESKLLATGKGKFVISNIPLQENLGYK